MPTPFLIRPFQVADLPAIVRLQQESQPLHPWSLEEIERDLNTLEPHLRDHFIVAEQEGELLGMADYLRPAGTYHPRRFLLHLCVASGHRGKGVGRALYVATLQALAPMEPLSIVTLVRETDPRSLRFAQERGFTEVKRDFESILSFQDFHFSRYRHLLDTLEQDGFHFRDFAELDSPDFRKGFHELFETLRVDVPRAEPPTPLTFDFFSKHVIEEPGMLPSVFVFALRGEDLLGFTGGYEGAVKGVMDTWLTAVARSMRGRGLALALKVRSIQAAKALGFTQARTDNDTRNAPMLRVNERLGFQRQPALITLRKTFQD
jgi:GNAT superfamily N-acetyltransferase